MKLPQIRYYRCTNAQCARSKEPLSRNLMPTWTGDQMLVWPNEPECGACGRPGPMQRVTAVDDPSPWTPEETS